MQKNKIEERSWMADMGSNLFVNNLVNFVIPIWFRYFFISSIFSLSLILSSIELEDVKRQDVIEQVNGFRDSGPSPSRLHLYCAQHEISVAAKSTSYILVPHRLRNLLILNRTSSPWMGCVLSLTCISFLSQIHKIGRSDERKRTDEISRPTAHWKTRKSDSTGIIFEILLCFFNQQQGSSTAVADCGSVSVANNFPWINFLLPIKYLYC